MIKFRSVDRLLQSEEGTFAKHRFMEIGIMLKEYEDEHYRKWLDSIITNLSFYFKQNLLIDAEQRPDLFIDKNNRQELINHSPTYRLPLYTTKPKDISTLSTTMNPPRSIVNKLHQYKEKCHLFHYVFDPMGTKKKLEIKCILF